LYHFVPNIVIAERAGQESLFSWLHGRRLAIFSSTSWNYSSSYCHETERRHTFRPHTAWRNTAEATSRSRLGQLSLTSTLTPNCE